MNRIDIMRKIVRLARQVDELEGQMEALGEAADIEVSTHRRVYQYPGGEGFYIIKGIEKIADELGQEVILSDGILKSVLMDDIRIMQITIGEKKDAETV